MSLYTKFGDTGDTMLSGGGTTKKDDLRIHAVGTVDELSALIGMVISEERRVKSEERKVKREERREKREEILDQLIVIQKTLHIAGADLAAPLDLSSDISRIVQEDVEQLERWIDVHESSTSSLKNFILPGGSKTGASLHLARTVCRRAERWIVALRHREIINEACLRYFNRLGDYLFAVARVINKEEGAEEEKVKSE